MTRLLPLVLLLAGCGATAAPTTVATVTATVTPEVIVPTETPTETPVVDVEALEWATPTPTPTRTSPRATVAVRPPQKAPEPTWTPTVEETVKVPAYGAERRRWDEVAMTGDPCALWRQDPLLLWSGAAQGASEVLDSTEWETIARRECG